MKKWPATFKYSEVVAGFLLILNACSYFGFWYIYLFAYQPTCNSIWEAALESFKYAFSDESLYRWHFVWMLIAPVYCCALALAYFAGYARSRKGALVLLVASVALGVATLVFKGLFAILIALPIFFGWSCFDRVKHEQVNEHI